MVPVYFSFTGNLKWIFLIIANSRFQSTEDSEIRLIEDPLSSTMFPNLPESSTSHQTKIGRKQAEKALCIPWIGLS